MVDASSHDGPLTIEQLVMQHGHRSMDRLSGYLPADYAARAARALWANRSQVLITTGFYVRGSFETDGPPGAFFLARALARVGSEVAFVCEEQPLGMLRALTERLWLEGEQTPPMPDFIEFPIGDTESSANLAHRLTASWKPSAVVAVERCGRTRSGVYRNMRGEDISRWTAQVDHLFSRPGAVTVGLGDGGNEVGMGALPAEAAAEIGITDAVATPVDHLVLAAVSNWGAYGIAAYLSREAGRDLLPTGTEEASALEILVKCGAVDGMTGLCEPSVDGFSLETDLAVLATLRGACAA